MRRGEQTDLEAAWRRLKIHLAVGEIDQTRFADLCARIGIGDSRVDGCTTSGEAAVGVAAEHGIAPGASPETGAMLLGRWQLERRVGGRPPEHVFRAHDTLRNEIVVVRVVVSEQPMPEPMLDRIRRHVETVRDARPPGSVRVLDVVVDALRTTVVVVEEAVDGQSLGELGAELRAAGELPDTLALVAITEQLLEALAALHDLGLAHGSVTSRSVVLAGREPGQPFAADQVDLRLVGADLGSVLLRPSEGCDTAADVVAAGQVVAELATGWSPQDPEPPPGRHLAAALGDELGRAVHAMVAPGCAGWFTAADGLAAVREALTGPPEAEEEASAPLPVVTVPPHETVAQPGHRGGDRGPRARRRQMLRRHRWWLAGGGVATALLALVVVAGVLVLGERSSGNRGSLGSGEVEATTSVAAEAAGEGVAAVRLRLKAGRPDGVLWLDGERVGRGQVAVDVAPGRYLVAVSGPEACTGEQRWIDVGPDSGPIEAALDLTCEEPQGGSTPARFAGDVWAAPRSGLRFRYVPPGGFRMGSPAGEADREADETAHQVTLTRGLWVGETEVTQAQWRALLGTAPSHHGRCGADCPVESITWFEAVAFANVLSRHEALEPCYRIDGQRVTLLGLECEGFRLPTEAEWEYAARSQTTTPYATGQRLAPVVANIAADGEDADPRTTPVASFEPNGWGLYDVHGNVREWVWDWYGPYRWSSEVDPVGPVEGGERVVRGGGCADPPAACRLAARHHLPPDERRDDVGLRLARTAPPSE
jgi:formylglycine-generating enzyme required for sulfatase activity